MPPPPIVSAFPAAPSVKTRSTDQPPAVTRGIPDVLCSLREKIHPKFTKDTSCNVCYFCCVLLSSAGERTARSKEGRTQVWGGPTPAHRAPVLVFFAPPSR